MCDDLKSEMSSEDILEFFDELEELEVDFEEAATVSEGDSDCKRRLRIVAVWTLGSGFCLWRKCRRKPACARCNKLYARAIAAFRGEDYLNAIWLGNRAIRCYCRRCC